MDQHAADLTNAVDALKRVSESPYLIESERRAVIRFARLIAAVVPPAAKLGSPAERP